MQPEEKMKITLSAEMYKLIKSVDFEDIENDILFSDSENTIELEDRDISFRDMFGEEYKETPINAILMCIDAEITRTGLSDEQNEILPRGQQLYELYDSIYYSEEA